MPECEIIVPKYEIIAPEREISTPEREISISEHETKMSELQNNNNGHETERSSNLFPVVGVGASAGGLEAFKRLIRAIPEHSGIAYILVQHLEPSHESMLVEILQKITRIPVEEITNNVRVEPDHLYVIPSNRLLVANDGRLELSPRPPKKEKNMPIDVFFASLAEVHQHQAIGVVLSGTATDGTLGLKSIKEHGGFTFAQEQQSAAFGGMPQSAIDAGVVDFILVPEDIPAQLAKLFKVRENGMIVDGDAIKIAKEDVFRQLLTLLRARKGADFTHYKQTTIRRRINRRMGLNKIENIADYLVYFKANASEHELLYQDLLIPVTGFFRDPKTYQVVAGSVFPLLLKDKDNADPLRLWAAGCSTGEEPYSMAICLDEYLGDRIGEYKIQIFATDISEKSLVKARSGIYTKRDIAGMSPERLERYFDKVKDGFQIRKSIRDICVFAAHNFLKDPPFAKMDFVSCRNVLIYMETFLQKRALTNFHYALKENGYLLLGHSETAAPASDLFTSFDKSDKIYHRKSVPGRLVHVASERINGKSKDKEGPPKMETGPDDFQKSADEMILSNFNPPGVVVNEQMEIVQVRGLTGSWLEPSPGKPSLNILKMAREGLAFEIRNALHKAKSTSLPVIKERIPLHDAGKKRLATMEVRPLLNMTEPYFLVLFRDTVVETDDTAESDTLGPVASQERKDHLESERNRQLEKELAQLREDMRSITQDQEAVNEELQSANEELLSGSEELQSLNEELETSKEEIQSTNEELTTLNQELFDQNEQLNLSRTYAESIVATIREPLIILDKELVVRTANRSYYKKFRSTEQETEGKSFYLLGNKQWDVPELRSVLDRCLSADGRVTDFEVMHLFEDAGERILLLNACRIAQKDSTELLILIAIDDITDARRREKDLLVFSRELEDKVEERTASLKESNVSLLLSNENLEQFATIASHDLQEPLRKIRTFSSILHQRYGKEMVGEPAELINKISLSATRMSELIHDVLSFSKVLDANVFKNVNLNGIVQHVLADFDLLIEQEKAVITCAELPAIRAVSLQMNQLFYNLIGNALKFTRPGVAPKIDISCRISLPGEPQRHPLLQGDAPYCEIVVSDNGIGIDEKYAEQIFLIFQRLNVKDRFEGTGIGLALCKKIVLNHKGEIYMLSEKGKGTQFHVLLPIG
jgi:two-component system CheB/CheR fusion protein